ncbi:MAG TPA: choice-of-anchor P family protein [Acidimicrobiales bacterium]|nr:choice-of-anchor P family protein [Acidimicrobiales bacterium]
MIRRHPPRRAGRAALAALMLGAPLTLVAVGVTAAAPAGAEVAGAPASFLAFTTAAQAPIAQITEDEPSASYHPEGEGEYGYTVATMGLDAASALSATVWPGSVAGNAGSLVGVLGGPSAASVLNDPVRAQAISGTDQTQQTVSSPTGTVMQAEVASGASGAESATAGGSLAGGTFGAGGSVGNSTTSSSLVFDPGAGTLTAAALSHADNVDLAAGLVSIGSVTSSATATSSGAAVPIESGGTDFQDLKIAGQSAYVDGSGVHLGSPGHPAPLAEQQTIDTALAGTGMQIYFTDPHRITEGEVSYYYAGSVLFYWGVPQDPSANSFTYSIGGAAVAMAVTPGTPGVTGRPPVAIPPPPSVTGPGIFTSGSASPAGTTTLSLPTANSPGAAISAAIGRAPSGTPQLGILAAQPDLPGGLGAGWWLMILLGGLLGAFLLPLVPGLFGSAAADCPRQRRP